MELKAIPAYKRLIPKPILRALAFVQVVGTVIGSFLPGATKFLMGTDPYIPESHSVTLQHRIYHFVVFGSTAVVLLILTNGVRREARAAASVLALGFLIETLQHLTGLSKVMEWWDVADDFYAITCAFLVIQCANIVAGKSPARLRRPVP